MEGLHGSKVEGRDKRWSALMRARGSTICSVRVARYTAKWLFEACGSPGHSI
jgi:hypothetical protein